MKKAGVYACDKNLRDKVFNSFYHSLRNTNQIKLRRNRTNYGKKAITYEGAQLYNNLPKNIKESKSLAVFKSKLKHYIYKLIY